ncbi:hypothetical protein ACOMHN_037273 [Nucella lapillus]
MWLADGKVKELCTTLTDPCPRVRLRGDDDSEGQLEMDRSAITLTSYLGAGHFAQVWKGKLHGRLEVAVKILKRMSSSSSQEWLKEVEIMKGLRHPRLVRLLAVCSAQKPVWIVMELVRRGSLLNLLRSQHIDDHCSQRFLSNSHLLKMAAQLADGMQYLQSRSLVHRDLRAANILVGDHYDVKVADFGLARGLDNRAFHRCTRGE